jgi:hydroxymethylpyrimidine/phosphomethylpyrimidine kinase
MQSCRGTACCAQKKYIRTLTIAGSDSGGGAGIQADLKTFAALNCFGMSAITCLTAQNTQQVSAVFPVPAEFVKQQIEVTISDIGVDAIKIGMLHNAEIISAVARALKKLNNIPIVLDPVMVATSGDVLLKPDAINTLREKLFPLATIITPNLSEAETLLQQKITSREQMEKAAKKLSQLGSTAVIIKGGHFAEKSLSSRDLIAGSSNLTLDSAVKPRNDLISDCLYIVNQDKFLWLEAEKINTKNIHGTGCTFSSAIAAYLAKGFDLSEAVQNAKNYITAAIKAGATFQIGHGHGPVCHDIERA